ncbi:rhamnosyltransferase WsaF family glycosyltransferase [Falsiroseomonas sp. E2-1-a20]|uniref:rhamnosyltransferase WsaF family glycosyltransferase n=1 Tax=Falsiroseomonas sp. E2-1-a20 TaxID=3239300 RepID=UPI003F37CF4D
MMSTLSHFRFGLDAALPDELLVGNGFLLHVRGWCYSANSQIKFLSIVAGGVVTSVPNHSWARADIFAEHCPSSDVSGNSLLSGFEAFVPFEAAMVAGPASAPREVEVTLRATLRNGAVEERRLGQITLQPGHGATPTIVTWPEPDEPRVAVCMATFNPPRDLFVKQIASLQAQTHRNWVCIIVDDHTDYERYEHIRYLVKSDPRFFLFQNKVRRNFYLNFEEGLRRTPADADFVALCDQDDVWHPDKLATLVAAFGEDTQLAYSDAQVVDEAGAVRSTTFWTTRRNNYTDLPTLMVANTITGAASAFRASMLPDILPFPVAIGPTFHDHWIGLTALVKGRITYVDRSLYDYVQHSEGVIGHNYHEWPGFAAAAKDVLRALPRPREMARRAAMQLRQSVNDHQFVQQRVMLARTLLLRHPQAEQKRRDQLQRFARLETSFAAAAAEKIAATRSGRATLNLEGMYLWAMTGTRLRNFAFRMKRRDLVRLRIEQPGSRLLHAVIAGDPRSATEGPLGGPPAPAPEQNQAKRIGTSVLEFGSTKWINHNISPLTLDVSDAHPKRVNLLLATIDFRYVFGGYIGMFNLALRLSRDGYRARIILHEQTDWKLDDWRRQIQKYPGLTTLFDEVEVISRFDRGLPVEVNPEDRFVATNCWAAHIAHNTLQQLGGSRFLFMVQEYEPYFLPMNSISALFQQAYTFPQVALFSTELLRDFFREEKIGVFSRPNAEANAMIFNNAIQQFHPRREQLQRSRRRLLFYARPEDHAARNLFELGMIALARLVQDPRIDLAKWSFHGIGSIDRTNMLELAPGVPLELVPKTSLQDYIDMMPNFDAGLSLMLTPHPSLVPLEMAAAGMLAVTNTFANKTAARLEAISANLIGVAPTVEAILEGLVEAMRRVEDVEGRLAGARVAWPSDWDSAFPAETMSRIHEFLDSK